MERHQPDNSPEAMARRKLMWQYVLPKVVEWEPANPLDQRGRDNFLDGIDNVVDLNANVFPIRPDNEAA